MPNTPTHLLLTGGTGLFGKSLLRYWSTLASKNKLPFQVTALSRNPEKFLTQHPEYQQAEWLHFMQGDMLDAPSLPPKHQFDCVIHAAYDTAKGEQLSPIMQYQQLMLGTENILKLAALSGAQRFLFISSGGVYGAMPSGMNAFPESYPGNLNSTNPRHTYGLGKRMAEHLCTLYALEHNFELVIARGFAFIGPDLPLDIHFAIGNFIADALAGRDIIIRGDGTPERTWMSQDDLAIWLTTLLFKGTHLEAYNVGSDERFTLAEAASLVRNIIAPNKQVILKNEGGSQRNVYIPDIAKAKNIGLSLSSSLADQVSLFLQKKLH